MATEKLPDAAVNAAWLDDHERMLAEFRALTELPCPTGKQKHATKKGARSQSASLKLIARERRNVYRCDKCDHWHCGRR